tara:strand:+ start:555 stop:803 length:249 start_codon:yes stop_codon:yes gene_type:complete
MLQIINKKLKFIRAIQKNKALYNGLINERTLLEIKEALEKKRIDQLLLSIGIQHERLNIITKNLLLGFSCGTFILFIKRLLD